MKKNIIYFIGLMTGLFLFSNTLLADSRPDWIDARSEQYPNSKYMSASGSASNVELAKSRALANLSKIFETHVKEISTTKIDTQVATSNGSESVSKNTRLAQQIQIRTDKIINGARIAANWKDKTVFTYYSLAVLDRVQAGNNIINEMSRLDNETSAMLDRSQSQKDILLSLSALDKAVNLQNERLTLQKMLKVIDTRGKGKPSRWNLAELSNHLENKLLSLRMSAEVESDSTGKLDQLLRSTMGNAGFPSTNTASQFKLVASIDVQDLGYREGWYWLRGKLNIKLVEANGKIRGRKQWLLKVSALQKDDAQSRLMTQANKKLDEGLKSAILEFATSNGS